MSLSHYKQFLIGNTNIYTAYSSRCRAITDNTAHATGSLLRRTMKRGTNRSTQNLLEWRCVYNLFFRLFFSKLCTFSIFQFLASKYCTQMQINYKLSWALLQFILHIKFGVTFLFKIYSYTIFI